MLEVLVSASLIAVISLALATTSTAIAPTLRTSIDNLDTARDVIRVQNLIARDLATYPLLDVSTTAQAQLPGSNALTLSTGEGSTNSGTMPQVVSYRYVDTNGSWQLVRYTLAQSGAASGTSASTVVSARLSPPPAGWTSDRPVQHAVLVAAQDTQSARMRTVEITFANGTHLSTSGTYRVLADMPVAPVSSNVPAIPLARCGGSITVVLNTSSSTWSQGAASTIVADLSNFVEALRGTPTHIRVVAFERSAYSYYPDIAIGTYVDMSGSSTAIATLLSRLALLSTTSSSWRNGRNWEDGLWQASRRDTGTILSQLPDTIIFITDGSPNRNRLNTSTDTDTTFQAADLTRAIAAADYARNTGSTLVGLLLGTNGDATAISHLASVFGPMSWDGSTNLLPLERARTFARPTTEGFTRLDEILDLIAKWKCASTITLQQQLMSGTTSVALTDTWTFTVTASDMAGTVQATVYPGRLTSTVDLGPVDSQVPRTVTISQEPKVGYRHRSVSCTSAGVALPTDTVVDSNGRVTIRMSASPTSTIACLITSDILP